MGDTQADRPGADPTTTAAASPVDAPLTSPPRSVGTEIGRYIVLGELGSGGMGVVYRAYDPKLDRQIALKVLKSGARDDAASAALQRAVREAQTLARLAHPNVVPVYDVGTDAGDVFVAMEIVDGHSLRTWCTTSPRSWREIVDVFLAAGRGLAAAHAAGIVHRDFKPTNVLVGEDGRVRVVDFGVARVETRSSAPDVDRLRVAAVESSTVDDSTISAPGTVVGTPPYMAPEQHAGQPADARCDQYAFCVAMFEALFGRRPFTAPTLPELVRAKLRAAIDVPTDRRVPAWVRRIVLRGLSPKPEDRYPDMPSLLAALGRDPAIARRRVLFGAVVVGLVAAAVGGPILARRGDVCRGGDERIAAVWSRERQQHIAAAFSAIGRTYADESWQSTRAVVDQWARAWVTMERETCEATQVHGVQSEALLDVRIGCLQRRLDELDAFASVLEQADARVVEHAVDAAYSLSDLSPCADVEALGDRASVPRDEATRGRVAELGHVLARARADLAAGRAADSLAQARVAQTDAVALGDRSLAGEAALFVGLAEEASGDPKAAETSFWAAIAGAKAGRDALLEAKGWIALVRNAGHMQAQASPARTWAELGSATLESVGGDPLLEADLLDVQAQSAAYAEADVERATELQQRALALRRETLGEPHPLVADTLERLGFLHVIRNRHDEAIVAFEQALDTRIAVFGAAHPAVAKSHRHLARELARAGRRDEAEAHQKRALAIFEAALGPEDTEVARALGDLGALALSAGDLDRAVELRKRAVDIEIAAHGPDHPAAGTAWYGLGATYHDAKRYPPAIENYRRALEIRRASLGPAHPFTIQVLDDLATVSEESGDKAAARSYREEIVAALEDGQAEAAQLVPAWLATADFLVRIGKAEDAMTLLEHALARTDAEPELHGHRPLVLFAIAKAESALHRPTIARRHAEEALAATEPDSPFRTEMETFLRTAPER